MIAIVGGGLIGLSCAWELFERGASIRLYEAEAWGGEARQNSSWAGAGMLAPEAETFPDEVWRARARQAALEYGDWVARLASEGSEIDFTPPREVNGRILDGQVDPRDLTRELRRRLEGRIEVRHERVTSLASVEGDQVLITAGAWSEPLVPSHPVIPIKGYMLSWTHLPPGSLPEVLHSGHTYVLQRRRGTVLAGSTEQEVGFSNDIDWLRLRDLRARAEQLVPALAGVPPAQSWWGFRPATRDGYPVIRRLDERVVLAYGHYRNGILLAPWTARWAAEQFGLA